MFDKWIIALWSLRHTHVPRYTLGYTQSTSTCSALANLLLYKQIIRAFTDLSGGWIVTFGSECHEVPH